MISDAVHIPGGGPSKVNIATDLELAALATLGRESHLTDAEMNALAPDALKRAQQAVYDVVQDKARNFLRSAGQAS
jgi:fructose-bisphosphate aldolase class II